jgi:hypothetical protein
MGKIKGEGKIKGGKIKGGRSKGTGPYMIA